jgi:DnaJ-class molecular chaperone
VCYSLAIWHKKIKVLTEAYEVLSDEKKRKLYNPYGHVGIDPNASFCGGGGNPFGRFQGFSGFSGLDGSFHFSSSTRGQEIYAEEFFEAFFGMGNNLGCSCSNCGPPKGTNLQMSIWITFQEAFLGVKKFLHLQYQVHNKKKNYVGLVVNHQWVQEIAAKMAADGFVAPCLEPFSQPRDSMTREERAACQGQKVTERR